jgi:hypothetical protein
VTYQRPLSIMHAILSLTNWIILTNMILLCRRNLYLMHNPVPFYLYTPNKSNLWLDSSFATVISEPALCGLLTWHIRINCKGEVCDDNLTQRGKSVSTWPEGWLCETQQRINLIW